MANQKQLDILKQGVEVWNEWWKKNSRANLVYADLRGADLRGANLRDVSLIDVSLIDADWRVDDQLNRVNLSGANLRRANLVDANLRRADLRRADLSSANLSGALLFDADLRRADLSGAYLSGALLHDADLRSAYLRSAQLVDADLSRAYLSYTTFVNVDLSTVKGLETLRHIMPSLIGIDTIYLSQGKIPESFLKGAGVPDSFIEYMRSLVSSPIDYYSCFISYSSKNKDFAERLYADLQSNHVRCWFAPEDMKIGDKIRPRIDESIRIYDKLLLVLTQYSIESTWVEKEVETAFDKEAQLKKLVLFPIRLDDTVMHSEQAWAADIRRTRHIGDFTRWKNHDDYQKALSRLLRDLKAEAQKMET